jgi:hypothetical protein
MSVYKTGRSTDYSGTEERPKPRPGPTGSDHTAEAVEQFERMAKGYAPKCSEGSAIAWVVDNTLTAEQRAWCRETARQIRREAELAKRPRPKPKQGIGSRGLNYNRAEREAMIARVLARYPDCTVNHIVVTTGLQRPTVMASEAWNCAQMGKQVKE